MWKIKEKAKSVSLRRYTFFQKNMKLLTTYYFFVAVNFFSVVRFPNNVCSGGSLNGTCYSAEECTSRGGVNDGSCAGGYGVCCTCMYALRICTIVLY